MSQKFNSKSVLDMQPNSSGISRYTVIRYTLYDTCYAIQIVPCIIR